MTAPLVDVDVELDPVTGHPICSHIVAPTPEKTAKALILEARIEGTPVIAICGYVWMPTRDPGRYPLCSRCRDIREQLRPDQDPSEIRP